MTGTRDDDVVEDGVHEEAMKRSSLGVWGRSCVLKTARDTENSSTEKVVNVFSMLGSVICIQDKRKVSSAINDHGSE